MVLIAIAAACMTLNGCWSKGAPAIGEKTRSFEVTALNGDTLAYDPAAGHVYVLYFWADWCSRCEDDFLVLDGLYDQWRKDIGCPRFIAVNVGQSEEHVQNFSKRMKTSFPIYMDRGGKIARSFGVKGLPTYFVIDRQGTVRNIILGWADENVLWRELSKIGGGVLTDRCKNGTN